MATQAVQPVQALDLPGPEEFTSHLIVGDLRDRDTLPPDEEFLSPAAAPGVDGAPTRIGELSDS